jgi:putrescine aminotransferase
MDSEALFSDVFTKYCDHINPYLAKLVQFAGFGVEVRAEGCYIYDHEGKQLLDCLGGYGTFALGHRHPKVVAAVRKQLDEICLSGKAFFTKPAADLADKLADIAPGDLQYSFFSNSGAEAVECALKFAKGHTGRIKIVSTIGSYHGKTLGALAVTGREKYRKRFEPLMPGTVFVEFGDAEAAVREIDSSTACMIVEPIQGEGGIIVPPDGYLTALRQACDKHGALLIFDEVQSGLGRAGYMFACEKEGVAPDMMTLAKSLGGGVMPIGCTMGTKEIWDSIYGANPLAHTSTFGASSIACAAGLAAINVIEEEGLVERSSVMGQRMLKGLQEVKATHGEMIAEVRGQGLMVGLEFSMDEVGELVVAQLLKRGVCVAYALNNPRVLRFEPPLIISEEQVDQAVNAVGESVAETDELLAALV